MEVTQVVIDYSQIVAICAQTLSIAMPIAVIFGVAGKAVNLMLSMILGKERVNL